MKIRCDGCDREEASVFCSADEAALCDGCDRRVHHANKLASNHTRFSLLEPAFKESPLCDICQERRAFLFCREDRAILCRECDIPIHRANEQTQKHNRFLLTGVKLSASSSLYQSSMASTTSSETALGGAADDCLRNKPSTTTTTISMSSRRGGSRAVRSNEISAEICPLASTTTTSDNGSYSTSSISEYLMETLPGWHVEDFLDPSQFASNGFCKTNSQVQAYVADDDDADFESNKNFLSNVSSQDLANVLVPQHFPESTTFYPSNNGVFSTVNYSVNNTENMKFNRNWDDISLPVPQISHPTFKRHRQFH